MKALGHAVQVFHVTLVSVVFFLGGWHDVRIALIFSALAAAHWKFFDWDCVMNVWANRLFRRAGCGAEIKGLHGWLKVVTGITMPTMRWLFLLCGLSFAAGWLVS